MRWNLNNLGRKKEKKFFFLVSQNIFFPFLLNLIMKYNPYQHTYLVVVRAYLFGTITVGYKMHVQNFPHSLFVPINYGERKREINLEQNKISAIYPFKEGKFLCV